MAKQRSVQSRHQVYSVFTALSVVLALSLAVSPATGATPAKTTSSKTKPAKKKKLPTVTGELSKLRAAGSISDQNYRSWRWVYLSARSTAKKLPKGVRKRELEAVIANTQQIAASKSLSATLAPSVFLTLRVNRLWWPKQAIPSSGARPAVSRSALTWQYYPKQGLQIQWLGTFGEANALAGTKTPAKLQRLKAIMDESIALGSWRAGGWSWQYLFNFATGKPPWASAMAQVTGMQALVRASKVLQNDAYKQRALDSFGLLQNPQSRGGVVYPEAAGNHLLLYSYSKAHVLNAFAQAVSGLREIAVSTADQRAIDAFNSAEPQLRAELASYDTGSWTLYQQGGKDSPVSYHKLARDLIRGLCVSLTDGQTQAQAGTPVLGTLSPPPSEPYCTMSAKMTEYLKATPNGPSTSSTARSRSATPDQATQQTVAPDPATLLGRTSLSQP